MADRLTTLYEGHPSLPMTYGNLIRNNPYRDFLVQREQKTVSILGDDGAPILSMRYPALLQLVTRLQEALKDVAKV